MWSTFKEGYFMVCIVYPIDRELIDEVASVSGYSRKHVLFAG